MKHFILILTVIFSFMVLQGCALKKENDSYLRIHIRANSNLTIDQNIKYKIKDQVINYLTPLVIQNETFDKVKGAINSNLSVIESKVDKILESNGFNYTSKVMLSNEFFPTRYYEDVVLQSNYYDALIIELGEAKGDNWWCVVYPPLCFLNASATGNTVVYKSKILELINNFFK